MPRLDQPAVWPPNDSPAGDLVRQLHRLSAVRRELNKVAHREISSHGFPALVAIRKRGTARVSEVASELQVDLSVASRQVTTLVDAGYVVRAPDPNDGRAYVLQATPAGSAALKRAFTGMTNEIEVAVADWEPDEIRAVVDGLARLTEAFLCPAELSGPRTNTTNAEPEVVR